MRSVEENVDPLILKLNEIFGENSDFVMEASILFQKNIYLCYFRSIVDATKTKETLHSICSDPSKDLELEELALLVGGKRKYSLDEAVNGLLEGKLLFFVPQSAGFILMDPSHPALERSITGPQNENVIQSSFDAFTEDMDKNIALLRKNLPSKELKVQSLSVGSLQQRKVGVISLSGKASNFRVDKIVQCLQQNKEKDIVHIQDLLRRLKQPLWNPLSTVPSSELSTEAVRWLMEGRVVIFLDRHPFALTVPGIIFDLWTLMNDLNYPSIITLFIRITRIVGLLISLIGPGLYVALVAVNPEVLRIQLALSVAQSREGVPYPAIIETLFMLIVLEMIVEASMRLPKSIGPTITMVGGIILGQAVVQAKLVSNLLIIILAATTISTFTIVGFQNSLAIRLFKYVILILGSIYGVLGVIIGIAWLCIYLSGITTFGIPYLSRQIKDEWSDD